MPVRLLVVVSLLPCLAMIAGCSSLSCGADHGKLAQLHEGMSYQEVSKLMGCAGTRISEHGLDPDEFSTIEWAGPDSLLFSRTHVVFFDRKLFSVMTYARGGF